VSEDFIKLSDLKSIPFSFFLFLLSCAISYDPCVFNPPRQLFRNRKNVKGFKKEEYSEHK
jgi:hypothetical protein